MSEAPRLLCLLCLLLGCALLHATARAAPDDTRGPSPDYVRAVDAALEEYQLGHFEEARSLFERAHAIDANARTLRGLGMVEFELRHYLRAATLLDQSLASPRKPLTSEQRESVQTLLARARQFIARYTLQLTPSASTVRLDVDGQRVALTADGGLYLEAGEHVLRVSAPGFATHEQAVDAKGGEQQTLRIELAATAQPQSQASPPASYTMPVRTRPHRKLGVALASVGAVSLAVGAVLGGVALARAESSAQPGDSAAELAHTLAISSDVALSVGIVSAIAGTVCLLYRRDQPVHPRARGVAQLHTLFPTLKVSF